MSKKTSETGINAAIAPTQGHQHKQDTDKYYNSIRSLYSTLHSIHLEVMIMNNASNAS